MYIQLPKLTVWQGPDRKSKLSSYQNGFFVFCFVLLREGMVVWREAEGDRERESQAGSTPSLETNVGLDLTTLRSLPEP